MFKNKIEKQLADILTIPLFIIDGRGNVLLCNKEFDHYFKIDSKKFIGKKIENLSQQIFNNEEGFILSSIKNGGIIKRNGCLKKGNFYYKESLLKKGNSKRRLSHFAQKLGKSSNFLEIIVEIEKATFISKSKNEESFLHRDSFRNFLTRKALYSLSKRYENFFDSILFSSESILSSNLSILTKDEKKLLNNILIESERAKRLSKTISYLGAIPSGQKAQNLNDKISSTEEFAKLLLGSETEITFALCDGIPYVNVREGIIEDFILQVILLSSSFATKHTKILIESGREMENKIYKSFVQVRVSETNPSAQKIAGLFKTKEAEKF
ncbi:MAG: hypothetical protein ACPLZH_02765, partial [Minisyncoccales bacterium]